MTFDPKKLEDATGKALSAVGRLSRGDVAGGLVDVFALALELGVPEEDLRGYLTAAARARSLDLGEKILDERFGPK